MPNFRVDDRKERQEPEDTDDLDDTIPALDAASVDPFRDFKTY